MKVNNRDRIERKLFTELVKLLHVQAKAAVPGSLLTGACLVIALHPVIALDKLLYWFSFIVLVSIFRYVSCKVYLQKQPPIEQTSYWYSLFLIITLLGSMNWILLSMVLMPDIVIYQVLIAFAVASIAAIAVPLFSASRFISAMFVTLTLGAFGIEMFMLGDTPHKFIALFTLIYLIVLILSSFRIHDEVRAMLKLQIENKELIERLYKSKNHIEQINAELQSEITGRNVIEKLLRNSEDQYRLVTNALPVLIAYIDTELYFRFNNKAYEAWFKKPLEEITNKPVKSLLGEAAFANFMEHYQQLFMGKQVSYETIMQFDNDQERYVSVTLIPHKQDNAILGLFSLMSDVTPRINYLATHDSLTNLPNRSLFNAKFTHAIKHAARHETLVALLFIDLDHFKVVNDSLGHDVGDQLLIKVVERLKYCVDTHDMIARLGGDEFTVILEDNVSIQRATSVAQRICESLATVFKIADRELFITTSIGISVFPDDGDNIQTLLKNADMAMYRAKDRGRNTFEFYTRGMNEAMQKKTSIGISLRSALERGELMVYYQPVIAVKENKIDSMEALLRWEHPQMGFISPGEFIPIAEETDLIVPIGEWVLRSAISQLITWHKQGHTSLKVTVNLSARQFMKRDLPATVAKILNETGIKGEHVVLELTESLLMSGIEHSIRVINELKALDVLIALDDFGTGYSSLSYLKRFPIDIIKIDKTFITDFSYNHEDVAIVKAIITLAHNLKIKVVAEGVEKPEQYMFLKQQGCDEMQGYLFCKPLAEIDATLVLQKGIKQHILEK